MIEEFGNLLIFIAVFILGGLAGFIFHDAIALAVARI